MFQEKTRLNWIYPNELAKHGWVQKKKTSGEQQLNGGKWLADVRGQGSDWANWWETIGEAAWTQMTSACSRSLQNSISECATLKQWLWVWTHSLAILLGCCDSRVVPNKEASDCTTYIAFSVVPIKSVGIAVNMRKQGNNTAVTFPFHCSCYQVTRTSSHTMKRAIDVAEFCRGASITKMCCFFVYPLKFDTFAILFK